MDTTLTSPGAKSLTSLAVERLRGDILAGQLRPAERLRIQALCERYGIGATAIREALSRLVTDGLVDSEDQRGFCVTPVSREDLTDLTQTRVEVECSALRLALEHGGIDWESTVLSAFHRLQRTPPPSSPELHDAWAAAHRQFHEALIAGCASPWMLRLCRLLYDQSERYRNLAEQYTTEKNRDAATEHRELMEAAMARDAERAVQLLAGHFWETTGIILKAVFNDDATARTAKRGPGRKPRSNRGET
ncbi:TPA: GntR family transcriptional regulator [Burkholderia cenocepacia]|uniref:FCD domain-containing protein n=1 Tax=Burkholderia latens TaxID=488446 RepID=A0A6H9SVH3_9BURK|nr:MULTISPECIES: FCD domain-containing protein [Burkholderia]KAB0644691.1 FCD domain-containing protein [Burkholderia latens]MBJ9922846.1 FCD domain-containing protein [Burkholderia cenocepacia]UJH78819.1 FCD domain-containing protein [Burkholderia cenocepacia]VWB22914.1 GntR family transcriptional regulator [Burkholderia latens]HDR9879857.1 FCD domain-containing protein [Burkholderia cenocepacia]